MLKVFSNFIGTGDWLNGMDDTPGDGDFYFHGNYDLKYKPITICNDFVPQPQHLNYNHYNILMIMEPNQLFGLHNYAIQAHEQFDLILTWGQEILDKCPNAVFHPFGISWLDKPYVEMMKTKEKQFEVSFLCGGKETIEGHHLRHRLHKREDEIKIPKKWFYTLPDYDYNGGHHTIIQYEGKPPGSEKKICWDDSMFSICVENSSNRGYFTEKVIDAFLSKTIPIYWGCKNIGDFFNPNGFIQCKDENEIIEAVNSLTPDFYGQRKHIIDENYEKAKYYADLYGRTRTLLLDICNEYNISDDVYASQEMEDKWICENLKIPEKGVFLDIGGGYPEIISNTYHFEKYRNWSGIIVEPDPDLAALIRTRRSCILEEVAIHPTLNEVPFFKKTKIAKDGEGDFIVKCKRLDEILERNNIKKIDLISIDVEGFEKEVWKTFNYRDYDPDIIITEHTEMGNYDDSFTYELLENDSRYEIALKTPLNFILIKKGLKK